MLKLLLISTFLTAIVIAILLVDKQPRWHEQPSALSIPNPSPSNIIVDPASAFIPSPSPKVRK